MLRFGSWSYGKNDIAILHEKPLDGVPTEGEVSYHRMIICPHLYHFQGSKGEFTLHNHIESNEWEILSKEGTLYEFKYDCCPDPYQELDFELVLKRRSYYPVMTLVIPCIITAILICLTFFLPPDAGEKVGLSKSLIFLRFDHNFFLDITILLAMVVFMDQLSAQTPPMKDNVPVIGQVSKNKID